MELTTTDPTIDDLLRLLVEREGSDLHLKPMRPPLLRLAGRLEALEREPLAPERLREMLDAMIPEHLQGRMERDMAVEFGYGIRGLSRFRASVFQQRGTRAAVFRRVPIEFPSLEDWGLPEVLTELCELPQGLVLITGPTGSGKSSTLAAMMQRIVATRRVHVVTVEDPIEFLLRDDQGSVTQREIGTDTPTFAVALRNALRQDPDVLMVGEMRDAETIQTVLTAAETGHLVFSTLHTNSAVQSIDRILDSFPERGHAQVRQQLASVLEGVITLRLLPRADGSGLVAAVEVLRRTPRASKLILQGKLESLDEEIESSVAYHRMQSINQSLAALVLHGTITREAALSTSANPADLDLLLRRFQFASAGGAPSAEGDAMADCTSDYSKILQLQEVKKLYDEIQERYRSDLGERDVEIARLREALRRAEDRVDERERIAELTQENERLVKQSQLVRSEYEAKIERLNERLRELSANVARVAGPEPERKSFFRR